MAARAGTVSLEESLKRALMAAQQGQQQAKPFDLQSTLQGADKAIQQGVFGAVDAIGSEGKRLADGKFGFDALSQALPQLAQSGPQNLIEALATTRQGGAQWTNQDLQAQRDRDNLGKAGGGAMDATWLLPAAGAAKGGIKSGARGLEEAFKDLRYGGKEGRAWMENPQPGLSPSSGPPSFSGPTMGARSGLGDNATYAARVQSTQPAGARPPGYDDWAPEWKAAFDKGLDMSPEGIRKRAVEQGFNVDEPLYRGQQRDFQPMGGVYASTDPEMANIFSGEGGINYPLIARGKINPLPNNSTGSDIMEGLGFDGGAMSRGRIAGEGFDGASYADQRYILDPANVRSPAAAFDPDNIGKPTMLGMGFPFGGKDGEKPLLSALMDAFRGGKQAPAANPLDQFTPPTSLDDIFTGGARSPRADTGPLDPRQPEGPAFNASTPEVGYDGQGFTGLDAQFTQAKNRNTLAEALAKREQKPLDPDLLSLLAAYGGAAGMGSALWAEQAKQNPAGANQRGF